MKTSGLFLILLSSLFFGLELSRPGKRRMDLLEDLCKTLELMHAEMASRPSSVESLCNYLAVCSDGAAAEFFCSVSENMDMLGCRSFQEIWHTGLKEKLEYLNPEDEHAMENLGTVLGSYDISEQLAAISTCRNRLNSNLQELRTSYPASRKLYLGLSCSFGAMLALILV